MQLFDWQKQRSCAWPVMLLLGSVLLHGCPGTLDFTMLGSPISDDDDDDDELQFDMSSFEGLEFVNIDWDQEAWPQGVDDCRADWYAAATDSTEASQSLCPDCSQIWSVSLTALDSNTGCMQGTGLEEPDEVTVLLGFEFLAELPQFFTVWRSTGDEAMQEVGIGAVDEASAEFTWSGQEAHRNDGETLGYEWFLSGEGSF